MYRIANHCHHINLSKIYRVGRALLIFCSMGDVAMISTYEISNTTWIGIGNLELTSCVLKKPLPWNESQRTSPMVNQHWSNQWLGFIRQPAVTWTSVDQDRPRHMASLGEMRETSTLDISIYYFCCNMKLLYIYQHHRNVTQVDFCRFCCRIPFQ